MTISDLLFPAHSYRNRGEIYESIKALEAQRSTHQEHKYGERLRVLEEARSRDQELINSLQISQACREQRLAARIYRCRWTVRFGVHLHFIFSSDNYRSFRSMAFMCSLYYIIFIMRLSFVSGWPRYPHFSLRPRIEIHADSAILKACLENNLPLIKHLISGCPALVNGITPDNLTLLRVSLQSPRLGKG